MTASSPSQGNKDGSVPQQFLRPKPENLKLPPSIDPAILEKPGRLGVAAVIHDGKGNVVIGQRAGSHGAGTFQFPGGHFEASDLTIPTTAIREALEETGLVLNPRTTEILAITHDIFKEGKEYITAFVLARIEDGKPTVPEVLEPEKCKSWEWMAWSRIWSWAAAQAKVEMEGREVELEVGLEKELFLPIVNLYRQYPGLEKRL